MAEDTLEEFIIAAAAALGIAARGRLAAGGEGQSRRSRLRHAATVEAFKLPDEAEPAPVFEA